ncbi:MAG TPA: enoyl-CoA hydratase-related protein [Burkholderiales bacterium]|nr:enoyl-CoA hydratase-related protein [Burkholderiales bacterium]
MSQPITVLRDGHIATVVISTPGKLNALSVAHWEALAQAMRDLQEQSGVRCIVLRGADGNFAAGADISEFATVRSNVAKGTHYHEATVKGANEAIANCEIPTLALIEGACVGGGLEIACCCDMRIAAQSARFGVPINRLGFPLAHAELTAMLGLVSRAVALEILLEGRVFSADEAYAKGLLTRIVPDTEIEKEAYAAAERIAAGSPMSARANKRWIKRLAPVQEGLTEAEIREHFTYFDSADYKEGVRAFLAKTKPQFSD